MTCIVAIRNETKVLLGGDSAASGNNRIVSRRDKKIFKRRGIGFGFAGSFRVGQLIKFQLKIPKHPINIETSEYVVNCLVAEIIKLLKTHKLVKNNQMECNLLITYKNHIYKIDSDFQVEVGDDPYAAIGDGADVALGALYALKDSPIIAADKFLIAMSASDRYCTTVSSPFFYIES